MKNEFPIFFIFFVEFCIFLRIFDEILSGFRDKFQKKVTCAAFSIEFAKTNSKITENSEITDSVKIIHSYSLLFIRVLSRYARTSFTVTIAGSTLAAPLGLELDRTSLAPAVAAVVKTK